MALDANRATRRDVRRDALYLPSLSSQSGSLFVLTRSEAGRRAWQKVLMVQGTMPRDAGSKRILSADMQGFSLHAAVRRSAEDRPAPEQMCR